MLITLAIVAVVLLFAYLSGKLEVVVIGALVCAILWFGLSNLPTNQKAKVVSVNNSILR